MRINNFKYRYLFAEKRLLNDLSGRPRGVDKQPVAPKNELSKLKPEELRAAIKKTMAKFEAKKALFEKYAKRMPKIKKIYEKLKKIEEKFNGLLNSASEAKREHRNLVLSKLGISQRLFRQMNYIHLNSLYLKTVKEFKAGIGKKYDVRGDHAKHMVRIGVKGKGDFAGVKRNMDGTYSIVYKNAKGEWEYKVTARKLEKVQKIIDGLKKESDEDAKKYAKTPEGQKEQKESLKQQDSVAQALVLLAKNQTVPANMQKALKAYLSGIQKNQFREYEVVMNKSLVRIAVARSADGKYYKAYIDCSLTAEGRQPKVLAERPPYSMSAVLNLKPDGKTVGAGDNPDGSKFPDVPDAFAPVKKPGAKVEKGPKKPKAKEKEPTTPRGKIAKMLKAIEGGGQETFRENLAQLKEQIKLLGLDYQKDNPQNLKIGGYTINYCDWSKHPEHKPSLMIMKGDGPQVICYKVGKPESNRWYHARPLGKHDTYANVTWTRRFVERHAANNALYSVLPQIKGSKGDLRFLSAAALKTFQASIKKLAAYSGKNWNATYDGVEIRYYCSTKWFKIIMPGRGGAINYHPWEPDKYRVPGQKGKKSFRTYSAKETRGMNKLKGRLKDREAVKKKAEEAKRQAELKKQKEEAKRQAELKKQREALTKSETAKFNLEERQALKKDLINSDYDKYVTTPDSNKPYSFGTDFGRAKNSRGQLLINKTRIHHFLKLRSMLNRGKVLRVIITDSKGKKRYGMYYPGQRSVYELKKEGGNQKSKPLAFNNGGKFKISASDPTQKDLNAVRRADKNKLIRPEAAQQIGNLITLNRYSNIFKKLNGKITDLNLTKLQKFKDVKSYKPSEIKWTQARMQKIIKDPKGGLKKLNEILRAEIAVVKEGIIKLRVDKKMGTKSAPKPKPAPTTKPPANPTAKKTPATKPSAKPNPPANPTAKKAPATKPPVKPEKPTGKAKQTPEAVRKAKLEQHQTALYKKLLVLLKGQNYKIEKADTLDSTADIMFDKKGETTSFAYIEVYPNGEVQIYDGAHSVIKKKKNYTPQQIVKHLKGIQKLSDSLKALQAELTRKLKGKLGSDYKLKQGYPGANYADIIIEKGGKEIGKIRLHKDGRTEVFDKIHDTLSSKSIHSVDELTSTVKAVGRTSEKISAVTDKMYGQLQKIFGKKYKLAKSSMGAVTGDIDVSRSKGDSFFVYVRMNKMGEVKIMAEKGENPVDKFTKLTPQQIAKHVHEFDVKDAAANQAKPKTGGTPQ